MRFRRLTTTTATLALALALLVGGSPAGAAPAPASYEVQAGDTLGSIAAAYGMGDWRPLWDANRATVADPDLIRIGQVLMIPGGVSDLAPPAVATKPASGKGALREYLYATAPYPDLQAAIIQCESEWNPYAVSRTNDYGLAQFHNGNRWLRDWTDGYEQIDTMNAWIRAGRIGEWACYWIVTGRG